MYHSFSRTIFYNEKIIEKLNDTKVSDRLVSNNQTKLEL